MNEPLLSHDLGSISRSVPLLKVAEQTSEAEAMASTRMLAEFNGCALGLVHFVGETPWEIHDQDELLHVLSGEVELTVLYDVDSARMRVRAGEVVVVPRKRWHRQHARESVRLLFVTSADSTDVSRAEDPRP